MSSNLDPKRNNVAQFLDGYTLNERKRERQEKSIWNLRLFCADKTEIESVVRTHAARIMYLAWMIFDICPIWRIYSRARLNDCARSRSVEDESAIRKDNKRIIERHKREEECRCLEDYEGLRERERKKNGKNKMRACDFIRELKTTIGFKWQFKTLEKLKLCWNKVVKIFGVQDSKLSLIVTVDIYLLNLYRAPLEEFP